MPLQCPPTYRFQTTRSQPTFNAMAMERRLARPFMESHESNARIPVRSGARVNDPQPRPHLQTLPLTSKAPNFIT
jgi:hypothetical protein